MKILNVIPVLGLGDAEKLISAIHEESKKAIEQDSAEAIVLGGTGMAGAAEAIRDQLMADGYDVPVVDPTLAAIKLPEVYGQLKPSRLTYMPIREKERL